MRSVRSILSVCVIALALIVGSFPAFATNDDNGNPPRTSAGTLSGFVGFGSFQTAGRAGSVSLGALGGGSAESFADGTAGLRFTRCNACGGANFDGFQTNTTGAVTDGPGAAAWGNSEGAAAGKALGGTVEWRLANRRGNGRNR